MTDNVIDLKPFNARKLNLNSGVEDELARAEAFDELVRNTARPDEDDVEHSDNTIPVIIREMNEMEALISEFEANAARQAATHDEMIAALNDLREITSTKASRDVNDDEQLSLAEACCLPELGGRLYENGAGVAGRHVKAKTLWEEIKAGRLRRVPPFKDGKFLVSRRTIREWLETAWQEDDNPRTSFGSSPSSTKSPVNSGRKAIGQSQTARNELARDSALSFVRKLKKPD